MTQGWGELNGRRFFLVGWVFRQKFHREVHPVLFREKIIERSVSASFCEHRAEYVLFRQIPQHKGRAVDLHVIALHEPWSVYAALCERDEDGIG